MAIQCPSRDEIRQIAGANHIAVSADDIAALEGMCSGLAGILERLEAHPVPPPGAAARYPDRRFSARPGNEADPLNAIRLRCSIKGAASGKLKGKRIGVKESVCMAGIPSSGGSAVLKDFVPDMDATIVTRMLDAGARTSAPP
jgi:amidase